MYTIKSLTPTNRAVFWDYAKSLSLSSPKACSYINIIVFLLLMLAPEMNAAIIGDLEWTDISILENEDPIKLNSLAIADLNISLMGNRCSGFLVSESVLMTNFHCVPTRFHTYELLASFDRINGRPLESQREYHCDEYIGGNKAFDYSLVRCRQSPGMTYGYLNLNNDSPNPEQEAYVIQQNCNHKVEQSCVRNKKVAFGKAFRHDDEKRLKHYIDTLPGSSGSPLFSLRDHRVLGIHYLGVYKGSGEGSKNFAYRMDSIVKDIQNNYPAVLPKSSSQVSIHPKIPKDLHQSFIVPSLPFHVSNIKIQEQHFYKVKLKPGTLVIEVKSESQQLHFSLRNKNNITLQSTKFRPSNRLRQTTLGGDYSIQIETTSPNSDTYTLTLFYE